MNILYQVALIHCDLPFLPLQTDLEEERIKQKIADRTRKDKCRIFALRVVLNVFVIAVLAGCFYCIYRATIFSQEAQVHAG